MMQGTIAEDEAIDPVCGMKLKKEDATHTMEYRGTMYYFCQKKDYEAFAANPEKYVAKK